MITNVNPTDTLGAVFRSRRKRTESKSVTNAELNTELQAGWTIERKNKNSVRINRGKPAAELLRDRVWSLLYRLQFGFLSNDYNPCLITDTEEPAFCFDVLGIDDEVVLAVVTRAVEVPSRWRTFDQEVVRLSDVRKLLQQVVSSQFPQRYQRQVVLVIFTANTHLTAAQRAKARELEIVLCDERDLEYYESLNSHIGSAAKYQVLAEMLAGKEIPGLSLKVPAIRARIGGYYCYNFTISPAYLLKIAYVSHRSKGKISDVGTYQRMLTKPRLKQIREYISEDKIFPTNIVLNFEEKQISFVPVEQPHSGDPDGGVLGLMSIQATYKLAWIIDGQHRLFAYSGHPKAAVSRLSVLAFEGLPASTQAQLFIDINAKQKSVKQALLQELYAQLNWNSDDPTSRIAAVISKAIQDLGSDPESPFFERIQTTDSDKSDIRCISLTSMFNALEKGGFFLRNVPTPGYGPFGAHDSEISLQRTIYAVREWFELIRSFVPDWWALGAGPGGGLAMNDGVTAAINVLRSVYQHLEGTGQKLSDVSESRLVHLVEPFGRAMGDYLASLSEAERKGFRDLRGNQGLAARTRRLQQAIRTAIPEYNPAGLDDYLQLERAQTNDRARKIVEELEKELQVVVIDALKREYGTAGDRWWFQGVPKQVRTEAGKIFEDDDGSRGGKEYYLNLIHYRSIITANWKIFGAFLSYGRAGREKGTSWLVHVNDVRRVVMHASTGKTVAMEDLAQLEEYARWFSEQVKGNDADENDITDIDAASDDS